MKKATTPSELGTNTIKNFLSAIFSNLKVDKDDNGEISGSEWGGLAFAILPQFLNVNLIAEAKDLTLPEVKDLLAWAKITFPQLSQLEETLEKVITSSVGVVLASAELYESVKALQAKNTADNLFTEGK